MHLGVDFKLWEYYFQQKGVDVGYLEADFGPLGIKLWLWESILGFSDLILGLRVNFCSSVSQVLSLGNRFWAFGSNFLGSGS